MEKEIKRETETEKQKVDREVQSQLKITALGFASGLMNGGTSVDTLVNNATAIYNFIK